MNLKDYVILTAALIPIMVVAAVILFSGIQKLWARPDKLRARVDRNDEIDFGSGWKTVDDRYISRTGW